MLSPISYANVTISLPKIPKKFLAFGLYLRTFFNFTGKIPERVCGEVTMFEDA